MRKKIFLLIILMFIFVLKVNASTTTYSRKEKKNMGVNKRITINENNKINIINTPLVDAKEKIYDFANILTDEEEKYLYNEIILFIEKYNTDVVLLTYDLPYYSDNQNEIFATDFYDYNDFGINYKNYNGILLFRNTYSIDPYFDVYSFGNAQLYMSQKRADDLLDLIYYDLHNANYSLGFNLFISEINTFYEDGIPEEMKNYYVDDNSYLRKKYIIPFLLITIISTIITLITIIVLVKKNKMVIKKYEVFNYLSGIKWNKKEDILINSHVTSHTHSDSSSSHSSSSSSSFSSHSGSSGLGHSSGGGRHG